MCMSLAEVCQVILGLGSLAVAYAAYSLAKRINANAKAEREKFETALRRHREEIIYQSKINTLATLVESKHPSDLGAVFQEFQKEADKIVPPLSK